MACHNVSSESIYSYIVDGNKGVFKLQSFALAKVEEFYSDVECLVITRTGALGDKVLVLEFYRL